MFLLFLLTLSSATAADPETGTLEEIVVSGKRLESDHRSARVWTEADLVRESGRSVGELLRESAGVDFASGTGGNSNLLIRGAGGSQTLVLIDGVKANDPSVTNRYFDWSRLDVRQVERIEILKGPQAVSYGSDAIGGVVLVTTRRGQSGFEGNLEGGSEGFARARFSAGREVGEQGGSTRQRIRFTGLAKGVFAGRSAALAPAANPGAELEGDDSREVAGGVALFTDWRNRTRLDVSLDLRSAREEIDAGAFDDDPNSVARNREVRAASRLAHTFDRGLELRSVVSQLFFRRAYSDGTEPGDTTASDPIYRGANSRAEVTLRGNGAIEWTTGIEYLGESLAIDSILAPVQLGRDSDHTSALFAETALPLAGAVVDFGGRISRFTSYGTQWSGKGGVTLPLWTGAEGRSLEFDIGLSTGFKAPSLYSLYEPQYGNPGLRPEESVQSEAGLTLRPEPGSSVSVRGFENRVRNRFGYDPTTFRSLNVDRATIRGLEFEAERRFAPEFRIRAHYTRLDSKDPSTGRALNDVARDKGGVKLLYDPSPRHSLILSGLAKGPRSVAFTADRLSGFVRFDLASRHRWTERLSITSRVENLFDREYSEVRGYSSAGISGYLGLEVSAL